MELKSVLEAILFSSQQPLTTKDLKELLARTAEHREEPEAKLFKKVSLKAVVEALETLALEHEQAQRSFRLVCVAEAWQFCSQPEYAPWIGEMVGQRPRAAKLSQPALETLAIIAYRQPLTRAEIEQIRGVAVDGVMQTLVDRGLVEQVGRADLPGRPITYGTSQLFLEHFGLRSLEALPAADELRRVIIERPEGPVTADAGLATAPPDELAADPAGKQTAEGDLFSTEKTATEGGDHPTERQTTEGVSVDTEEQASSAVTGTVGAESEPVEPRR